LNRGWRFCRPLLPLEPALEARWGNGSSSPDLDDPKTAGADRHDEGQAHPGHWARKRVRTAIRPWPVATLQWVIPASEPPKDPTRAGCSTSRQAACGVWLIQDFAYRRDTGRFFRRGGCCCIGPPSKPRPGQAESVRVPVIKSPVSSRKRRRVDDEVVGGRLERAVEVARKRLSSRAGSLIVCAASETGIRALGPSQSFERKPRGA